MGAGLSTIQTKAFKAEAAVTKRRIVKFGAGDDAVLLAAAVGDLSIGVSSNVDAAIGEPCDVHLLGIAEVEFGGTIARGAKVTSDATGRAVAAAPAAGVNNQVIGIATVSGVVGDIGSILIAQSVIQG